ncbi:MAG: NrfD/PsrC family molybdoenzyme membrane anchor subunit [Janthinobacterium lividum]
MPSPPEVELVREIPQVPTLRETSNPSDVFTQITPAYDIQKIAKPERVKEPGYYGLPILKRPAWKWEIAIYFFFEGISGGAYVLCTMASLIDAKKHRNAIQIGRFLSFLTMLPCPPLLIVDLGRPERFHHMLRIWKKTSPMNHGAWALSGYGIVASFLTLLAWPAAKLPFGFGSPALRFMQRYMPERAIGVLGMPFALTMVSYPGVLLSTTANPVWSHSHFLGSLFACSSMNSGSAAMTLCNYFSEDHKLHKTLSRFEDVATIAEAAALGLYLGGLKKASRPLFKGRQAKLFLFGALGLGIVAPAILRRSKSKAIHAGLAPLLTIIGSLSLKWSITYAGQESAMDAELASKNSPQKSGKPFWGPSEIEPVPSPTIDLNRQPA